MNKKSFIDKIDDETLAKMIDKTLNYEKRNKAEKINLNIIRMIPAVAAILLVIGLVSLTNIMPFINSGGGIEENPGAAVISENPEDTTEPFEEIAYNDDAAITQIGELSITTPRGQEPIVNDNGTITLPGGGMYRNVLGDKFTVPGGVVINKYGGVETSLFDNTGQIIIEKANGDILILDENGDMTVNGMTMEEYFYELMSDAMLNLDDLMERIDELMANAMADIDDIMAEAMMNMDGIFENFGDNINNFDSWLRNAYTFDELIKEIYDEALLVEREFANISDITLDLITDNVIISRGGSSVKIKYYEWTDGEYKLTADDNGNLRLKYMDLDRRFDHRNGDDSGGWVHTSDDWVHAVLKEAGRQICPENPRADKRTIEITVPENMILDSLDIENINGNINISDISVNRIHADAINGSITINNCANGLYYRADTINGSVNISNCNDVQNIMAETNNGSATINNCNNIQSLTASTMNGSATVSNCDNISNLTAEAMNGSVIISDCNNIQTLKADTMQGAVTIKNSVIQSASASTMTRNGITITDCDIATLKVNSKTHNNVQNGTFDPWDWEPPEPPEPREPREPEESSNGSVGYMSGMGITGLRGVNIGGRYTINGDTVILYDGTKITNPSGSINNGGGNSGRIMYVQFNGDITVEYTNGIIVNAPRDTKVEFVNDGYTITIGNSDAAIIQLDGISSTVPGGTVLDNEGNIIN